MRIAGWNVEWFNSLFDGDGTVKADDEPSGREGVSVGERARAVAQVLRALDADAVVVIEAPDISRRRDGGAMLGAFARRAGIRARRVLIGFANDTRQEIALLHDPHRLEARHDPREAEDAPRFDGHLDLEIEGRMQRTRFSKPPLEVACRTPGGGFRLVGVHAKSTPVGEDDPSSRRKLLGQCVWLRRRIEAHLDAGEALIVLGDLNSEPTPDDGSGVGIVMGRGDRRLHDPNAEARLRDGPEGGSTSVRFRPRGGEGFREALLDYALVSPTVAARGPRWRIWHPLRPPCSEDAALSRALLAASDHFPVTIDVEL